MKGPDDKPPLETHCFSCGGELATTKAEKKRLGNIFSGRWQWHIDNRLLKLRERRRIGYRPPHTIPPGQAS